jgi:hypothetical protein
MEVGVGASEGLEEIKQKETIKALVVEDVKILKRVIVVDVPKYIPVEQIKFTTKEETQTKLITKEEQTIKFIVKEEPTTKFVPREEETIRYKLVEKEYEVERPVLKDKMYERPVLVDKEYVLATYRDVDALKELFSLIPKAMDEIQRLKLELAKVREYKLVEEIVRVPQIKYIPTEVERVVWKDVPRERCKECGKEIV